MIEFITGDIVTMKVDAIVNAANTGLVGGAGLCGMIHDAAGSRLDAACRKIGYCLRGDAVITKGYNLPAKYIIHTVGPIYGQHHGLEAEILYSCYYESLRLADKYSIKSIAFPYISTGIYQYPHNEATIVVNRALKEYFQDYPKSSIDNVYVVEYVAQGS